MECADRRWNNVSSGAVKYCGMAQHVIQLFVPVVDNDGKSFEDDSLERVKETLVKKFGGVTAYTRSPAHGVWASAQGQEQHDDVVVVEVMTDDIDDVWWKRFRTKLECDLRQEEIVVRVFPIRTL